MEFRELRSLMALAESGSITVTAERLCLSPGAVHKQLKSLEQELGVTLYERVGRQLQLTQATDVVLPYLKEMMVQYDSAVAALGEWRGMKRGIVRIGAGPTLSSYILPQLLRKFRRSHPSVELTVETGNTPVLLESLAKGAIDLALLVSTLMEGPAVTIEAHWKYELVLVSHRPHTTGHCHLAELKSFPFILFHKGSRMQEPIDRYFAANDLEPRVIMRFDSAESIKAMIRAGLGISMLPLWTVDADLKTKQLSLIRQEDPPLLSNIALVSRKSAFVPRAAQAFIAEARDIAWKSPRLTTGANQRSGNRSPGTKPST